MTLIAREIAKRIGKMMEEEAKEFIEELEKEIAEDDKFQGLEKLQSVLDEHVKKIEEFAARGPTFSGTSFPSCRTSSG
jgi:ribosome recycling factor